MLASLLSKALIYLLKKKAIAAIVNAWKIVKITMHQEKKYSDMQIGNIVAVTQMMSSPVT